MANRNYFSNAAESIKILFKNPILYTPDLILYAITSMLTLAFLYFNGLHVIFSDITLFTSRIRDLAGSSGTFVKLISSLIVFMLVNIIFGLGTVCFRYVLIKNLIENKKISLKLAYKSAGKYLFPILGVKIFMILIYLLPLAIFISIGFAYKPLLILMIFLLVLTWIFIKIFFLFTYPTLFLKHLKGPIKVLKESINYFENNKKHTFLTALFIFIVSLIVGLVATPVSPGLGVNLLNITTYAIVLFIIKSLIDITLMLWSLLFLFKNYQSPKNLERKLR